MKTAVESKLKRRQGTDHDQSGGETGERTSNTQLAGQLGQQTNGRLSWGLLGLVDLGQQSVGWLRDNCGHTSGNNTSTEVDTSDSSGRQLVLWSGDERVDGLGGSLVGQELSNVVRNLLEQNWSETVVERANTLFSQNSGETANQTVGEGWLRNKSNSGSLQWTQSNVGKELSNGSGTDVDRVFVLDGVLSAGTLVGNNLLERTNHTGVVDGRLKLDSGLDNVDRGHRSVGNTAADGTSKSEFSVVTDSVVRSLVGRSHREYYVF
ncbi:hypothetical protein OGATHE_005949 [Ogataea polymorpha]|uniref:Uncharacterized protein n=1 Tax=Ogataea polymorpha TaxID=460523 RepID=A0A9P8NV03_9ASCO|nr:hypothetical protein OGATHE_005949 [Ogataea polymorpha]